MSLPKPPVKVFPKSNWNHINLYNNVKDAIYSLPSYFETETTLSGINATDIFTLGFVLSATIEEQVIATLNLMRDVWDPPPHKYRQYSFIRQGQSFPDVILKNNNPDTEEKIIMGIELKSWYLLAKEGEPSFRYQTTPEASSDHDLIVIVPWTLSNVLSGSPKIFKPYIESSKYAALYRNYHWQFLMESSDDKRIVSPLGVKPYPMAKTDTSDKPVSDSGKNFGRFSRTRLMDDYVDELKASKILGIEARYWLSFFKIFKDRVDREAIEKGLENLSHQ